MLYPAELRARFEIIYLKLLNFWIGWKIPAISCCVGCKKFPLSFNGRQVLPRLHATSRDAVLAWKSQREELEMPRRGERPRNGMQVSQTS
jgi:hypothetical protein